MFCISYKHKKDLEKADVPHLLITSSYVYESEDGKFGPANRATEFKQMSTMSTFI